MSVFPAGNTTRTVGENFNLQCSVDIAPNPLPENVPTPSFEWFFGSNNTSLPSGVTLSSVTSSGNTYTSILQFSPLQESHTGMYTCRLGGNARLANNAIITVNGKLHHSTCMSFTKIAISPVPTFSVQITISGTPILGQNMYTLTCDESLPHNFNPTITYQWSKDNGTRTQVGKMNTLSFSSLKLSDAGEYTCLVTASASYLSNNITSSESLNIRFQSESVKGQ